MGPGYLWHSAAVEPALGCRQWSVPVITGAVRSAGPGSTALVSMAFLERHNPACAAEGGSCGPWRSGHRHKGDEGGGGPAAWPWGQLRVVLFVDFTPATPEREGGASAARRGGGGGGNQWSGGLCEPTSLTSPSGGALVPEA